MLYIMKLGCLAEQVMPKGSERLQLSVLTDLSPALLVLKCGHSSWNSWLWKKDLLKYIVAVGKRIWGYSIKEIQSVSESLIVVSGMK